MNYPVWYLPETGGGLLIALIAITHVFVAHFAVGGGLYLVLTERKGLRENNPDILAFTKRHTRFFMLVTMVYGGITGVGIWFIISLVQPAATSLLIHTFVYGWAAEWVWFLVEITALLVYYYTFDRMDSRTHQAVGWIYFVAAWLSLFLINGIIDFMLTPGAWVVDHNFWSGFFNPSFWPSLFFRTFLSFMLAGLYAFVTCAFLKDPGFKAKMTRYSGTWALGSLTLMLPCAYWYFTILPEPARALVTGSSPTIRAAGEFALYAMVATMILLLLLTVIRPAYNSKAVAILALVPAFLLLGAFEWTREAARRPFVLNQVMYSNGVTLAEAEELQGESFLARTKWAAVHEVSDENLTRAGAELFKFQCYACHTIGGLNNDILPKTAAMDFPTLHGYLLNVIHKRPYMQPFLGTEEEAAALAAYIVGELHGKDVDPALLEAPTGQGQKLYEENCVGCHGLDIIEEWAQGLTLSEIIAGLESLSSLNDMMENFSGTTGEKELLAGFFQSPRAQPLSDVETGRAIFEQNCTGCHGSDVIVDWSQGRSVKAIAEALVALGKLNPMMAGLSLDDAERQAVAAWALSGREGEEQ